MKKSISILLVLILASALVTGELSTLAVQPVVPYTASEDTPTTLPTEPSNPEPFNPEPSDPEPAETKPTEPAETKPTEPAETKPTEPEPTEPPTPPVSGMPVITKHPTSETVREGGYAEFVARADSCTDIIWHLQSPGGSNDVLAKDAPNQFPGLHVTGLNTERLGLDHIPKSLNEWRVRAEFVGRDGNVWSDPAIITVMNQELAAPTISRHPIGANLAPTEGTTLRITALTSEPGTTLTYQWYKNTINSNIGGKAILGATTESFTPDYAAGTAYYYCAVRCTNGSESSPAAKSNPAAVTYLSVSEPATAAPTAAPTTAPTAANPGDSTLTPWEQPTQAQEVTEPEEIPNAPARSNSLLLIIVAIIVLIAVLGFIAIFLILKFYPHDDDGQEPPRRNPPSRPAAPGRSAPPRTHAPKFAAKPTRTPPPEEDEEWDDLSDLGDLSIYLDDDSDDQ